MAIFIALLSHFALVHLRTRARNRQDVFEQLVTAIFGVALILAWLMANVVFVGWATLPRTAMLLATAGLTLGHLAKRKYHRSLTLAMAPIIWFYNDWALFWAIVCALLWLIGMFFRLRYKKENDRWKFFGVACLLVVAWLAPPQVNAFFGDGSDNRPAISRDGTVVMPKQAVCDKMPKQPGSYDTNKQAEVTDLCPGDAHKGRVVSIEKAGEKAFESDGYIFHKGTYVTQWPLENWPQVYQNTHTDKDVFKEYQTCFSQLGWGWNAGDNPAGMNVTTVSGEKVVLVINGRNTVTAKQAIAQAQKQADEKYHQLLPQNLTVAYIDGADTMRAVPTADGKSCDSAERLDDSNTRVETVLLASPPGATYIAGRPAPFGAVGAYDLLPMSFNALGNGISVSYITAQEYTSQPQ